MRNKRLLKNIQLLMVLPVFLVFTQACDTSSLQQNNTLQSSATETPNNDGKRNDNTLSKGGEEELVGYVYNRIVELNPQYGQTSGYQGVIDKKFQELEEGQNILTIDWLGKNLIHGVITNDSGQISILAYQLNNSAERLSLDYQGALEFDLVKVGENNIISLVWYEVDQKLTFDEEGFRLLIYDNEIKISETALAPIDLGNLPKEMSLNYDGTFDFEELTNPQIKVEFLE